LKANEAFITTFLVGTWTTGTVESGNVANCCIPPSVTITQSGADISIAYNFPSGVNTAQPACGTITGPTTGTGVPNGQEIFGCDTYQDSANNFTFTGSATDVTMSSYVTGLVNACVAGMNAGTKLLYGSVFIVISWFTLF